MRILKAQGLVTLRQGTGGGPVVGDPDGDAPLARDLACGHLMEISAIATGAYPGLVDEMIEWR